jgi:hypothetical protein
MMALGDGLWKLGITRQKTTAPSFPQFPQPLLLSLFQKEENRDPGGEVSSDLHGQEGVRSVKRTQSRPRFKWPVLTRPQMAAFEVITEGVIVDTLREA